MNTTQTGDAGDVDICSKHTGAQAGKPANTSSSQCFSPPAKLLGFVAWLVLGGLHRDSHKGHNRAQWDGALGITGAIVARLESMLPPAPLKRAGEAFVMVQLALSAWGGSQVLTSTGCFNTLTSQSFRSGDRIAGPSWSFGLFGVRKPGNSFFPHETNPFVVHKSKPLPLKRIPWRVATTLWSCCLAGGVPIQEATTSIFLLQELKAMGSLLQQVPEWFGAAFRKLPEGLGLRLLGMGGEGGMRPSLTSGNPGARAEVGHGVKAA